KNWITAEILDLCDKRGELRKKRFEPEGAEKYKEVNNNIKRCMKKAKENWIGEQCSEIEENLRKNNSKRAYQLVKDLTTVKQGKATTVQDRSGKCLTEERQILNRWMEYCSELYNHKTNGDPSVLNCTQTDTEDDHPILRREVEAAVQSLKKGKSAVSRQHPSRTGPSRWRGCNHRSHDNLQQDLAEKRMANPMDPVLSHHTS
ncbi:hypothetical protein, partial [Thiolapillus sp.]|uniref:hypothetical protein n=1 Tax=Thiolapillus sp. TaxID=2017437 RepID=UPI003AF5F77B